MKYIQDYEIYSNYHNGHAYQDTRKTSITLKVCLTKFGEDRPIVEGRLTLTEIDTFSPNYFILDIKMWP